MAKVVLYEPRFELCEEEQEVQFPRELHPREVMKVEVYECLSDLDELPMSHFKEAQCA